MAAPWHLNKDKFRDMGVKVRSSNYTLYGDMSSRVMRTLAEFSPRQEIYSINRSFIGLQGMAMKALIQISSDDSWRPRR